MSLSSLDRKRGTSLGYWGEVKRWCLQMSSLGSRILLSLPQFLGAVGDAEEDMIESPRVLVD